VAESTAGWPRLKPRDEHLRPTARDMLVAVAMIYELTIERLLPGALGLARLPSGQVVLLPGVLPNERVKAEVIAKGKQFVATVKAILQPSDVRVALPPHCPPTLDFAFASYQAQLLAKEGFVLDVLRRIAKLNPAQIPTIAPTHGSPQAWGYRNSAQYLLTPQGLAYRQRASHQPWPVTHDPLLIAPLAALLAKFPAVAAGAGLSEVALRGSLASGETLVALIGSHVPKALLRQLQGLGVTGALLAAPSSGGRFRGAIEPLFGAESVLERYGRFLLSVTAQGFAQVNPLAAGLLYQRVAQLAGTGLHAVDLYGGAGGLGFHLLRHFADVTVLEINAEAVAQGQRDAQRLGLEVLFVTGDAARLARLRPDVIVADPPRAGLSPAASAAIIASPAERLVYVSCDPATWARDAGALVRAGFQLTAVQPFDFYPQTSHVEVLSLFER
jgi:23S rRNA (uracil1939-C5)-methyltransferase